MMSCINIHEYTYPNNRDWDNFALICVSFPKLLFLKQSMIWHSRDHIKEVNLRNFCIHISNDSEKVSRIKVIEDCTNFYFGTEKLPPKF